MERKEKEQPPTVEEAREFETISAFQQELMRELVGEVKREVRSRTGVRAGLHERNEEILMDAYMFPHGELPCPRGIFRRFIEKEKKGKACISRLLEMHEQGTKVEHTLIHEAFFPMRVRILPGKGADDDVNWEFVPEGEETSSSLTVGEIFGQIERQEEEKLLKEMQNPA